MSLGAAYPVRVEADLDPRLSRWLWLVKWLLAVPHYLVLALLWVAFLAVSVVAFVAIVFTGRYPQTLFDFNVGVLRWTWRVGYYSYSALGTDRYPPFTLADVPDYPAHLEVAYPNHLSRGLVWVKWWLLALPQYLIVGLFAGGGAWAAWQSDHNAFSWIPSGLIGLLVFFAAVGLAATGRYPRQIFDVVLGLNRWVLRVAAYAALMTDEYPPFRLDLGGHESASTMVLPETSPVEESPGGRPASAAWPPPPPPSPRSGWTAGRIVSLVLGSLLAAGSLGLLAGASATTWLDSAQRDTTGYVSSSSHAFATTSYALTSDRIDLGNSNVIAPSALLGTVRVRATAQDPAKSVFIGIAPRTLVDTYLAGVNHAVVTDWSNGTAVYRQRAGGPPRTPPTTTPIWMVSVSGSGTQTLTWKPSGGEWVVVVMNPDASPGVSIIADAGATLPALGWIAAGLFAAGALLLAAGAVLIVVPAVRASRPPRDQA
jgi:hypothetical protein